MNQVMTLHRGLSMALLALGLTLGCSGGDRADPGATGGAQAGGGSKAAGGKAGGGGPAGGGSSSAGQGGAAGSGAGGGDVDTGAGGGAGTDAGGATGGAGGRAPDAGSGGAPGSGGAGATGGSSGQGGSTGKDAGPADKGPDTPPDTGPVTGPSLDACFAGMRALSTASQISTKRSADGKIEARIALEVDGFGTSGTRAWRLIRIGIVTPDAKVCLTDENALRTAYKQSHHNCSDVMVVTAGGRSYEFKLPDTDTARAATTLTIITGGTPGAAVKLDNVACRAGSPTGDCRSGGPC